MPTTQQAAGTKDREQFPEVADEIGDRLITPGWACDLHPTDVVLPVPSNKVAWGQEGWAGVRIHMDGKSATWYVPTTKRELPDEILDERGVR